MCFLTVSMSASLTQLPTTIQAMPLPIMLVMDLASLMKRSTPRISAKPATGMSPTAERVAANTINPDPETPAAPLLVKRRTVNSVAC